MKIPGLNARQCRAIVALADKPLTEPELADAIGPYATNTIKALAEKNLTRATIAAGVVGVELTDVGRAMYRALEPQRHRHQPATGAHA